MATPSIFHYFRVVADPETRSTQSGNIAVTVRLVADDSRPDGNGGWLPAKNTFWTRGTAWNQIGQEVSRAVKGDRLLVGGILRTNEWEDKNTGEKKSATEIDIKVAQVLPKQNQQGGYQQQPQGNVMQAAQQQFQQQGMTQQQNQQQDPWGNAPQGGFQNPPF
jgi:single-strand DNA-binding protein